MPRRLTTATAAVLAFACARPSAPAPAPTTPTAAPPAPYDIAYTVTIGDPAAHLYDIQLDVGRLTGREDTVALQLPVWSPGRYARMDFARNVQGFRAESGDGRVLEWDKSGGSRWRVLPAGARALRLRYRVFANDLSGTFSVLDTAHANWNGASLFMYVEGHKPDPVRLTIAPPDGWRVLNGWADGAGQTQYRFANYDILIDTPTEVAPAFEVDSFRVDGILYRAMIHHNARDSVRNYGEIKRRFTSQLERIVRYQNGVIGVPPITTYTFLLNIGYRGGDGMEHLNSTQVINANAWSDTATLIPGITTSSHEYFHTWNVKRIRPAALGPFDYTAEQHQPSLWVAEGWTNYYGNMSLVRAGIIERPLFFTRTANMIRANLESPGRKEVSARMASFHAPFWDGGASPMRTNGSQTFFSYYTKGEGLALMLDLEIRARTANARSLDDVLRHLKRTTWDEAPRATYYLQGRGYTEQDVERAASEVMGTDMHPWFERYVAGTDDPPFAEALAKAGMRLTVTGDGAERRYTLEEMPDATPAQRVVRDGWLRGVNGEGSGVRGPGSGSGHSGPRSSSNDPAHS